MAQPALSHTAQRLYDALEPLSAEDEANGWALAYYCGALAAQLDTIADLSRDQDDGTPGWAVLFDPDECPALFLPWMAQFVGVQIPPGLDEAQQRQRIKETDGFKRGTPDAIRGAARQFLTGSQYVALIERDGSPYTLTVVTRTAETPLESSIAYAWDDAVASWADAGAATWNSVATGLVLGTAEAIARALLEQKPAGLILNYFFALGETWNEAAATWNGAGSTTWDTALTATL